MDTASIFNDATLMGYDDATGLSQEMSVPDSMRNTRTFYEDMKRRNEQHMNKHVEYASRYGKMPEGANDRPQLVSDSGDDYGFGTESLPKGVFTAAINAHDRREQGLPVKTLDFSNVALSVDSVATLVDLGIENPNSERSQEARRRVKTNRTRNADTVFISADEAFVPDPAMMKSLPPREGASVGDYVRGTSQEMDKIQDNADAYIVKDIGDLNAGAYDDYASVQASQDSYDRDADQDVEDMSSGIESPTPEADSADVAHNLTGKDLENQMYVDSIAAAAESLDNPFGLDFGD